MGATIGRRGLVKALAFGTAAGLATTPALGAESAPTPDVVWRLSSGFPKTLDLMFGGAETFAQTVGDLTDGRFRIEVLPPGEAVSVLQALDAVQAGTVDACHTSLDYFYGKEPALALATAIPFGMNAREQFAFSTQGGGNDLVNEILSDYGAIGWAAGNTGAQMGGFFRHEIKSVLDLSGLKIRVGGLAGRVLQKLGAVPQATPRAEFVNSLGSGALDAVTWVSPHDDEKLDADDAGKLQKLAPNYYYPGWWRGGSMIHVVVNLAKYEALPKPYQAALRVAASATHGDMLARYDAANPAALRRLVVSGAQLRPFPQDVLEAAFKATSDTLRELADGNARFKKNLDATLAFRGDQYLWWQVGEYTFDNFMIRQRAKG